MTRLLLDTHAWVWSLVTHAWVWSLVAPERLTGKVKAAILRADSVQVSPVSLYEVAWKVRLGKWPEVRPHLEAFATETETLTAPLTRAVAARGGTLEWVHRDPFDRLIAATAMEVGCALISKDTAFDALEGKPGWQGRVWA